MNPEDIINMDYKIGDKVRIREDLKVMHDYSGVTFYDFMTEYLGAIVTICDIYKIKEDVTIYSFIENPYDWSEIMIKENI